MAQRDYYSVLGVSSSATADEIKKQYRRLAKQHHPDANASTPKSAERFKEISEAYTVLGNAEKRKQYDEMRRLGAFDFSGSRTGPHAFAWRAPGSQPGSAGAGSFRFEDFDVGGLGGLGDLFGSMFGGGAPPSWSRTGAECRDDARGAVQDGGGAGARSRSTSSCPRRVATCGGTGAARGAKIQQCPECGGRGSISFGQGGFAVSRPCPMCLGRGTAAHANVAPRAAARATCGRSKKVMITVPAGKRQWREGPAEGAGWARAQWRPARRPRHHVPRGAGPLLQARGTGPHRDGADQHRPGDAWLEGEREDARRLEGLPSHSPGTPGGKRFRVREQGIRKDAAVGDLIVEVQIVVPEALTPEQRELMERFAEVGGLKH